MINRDITMTILNNDKEDAHKAHHASITEKPIIILGAGAWGTALACAMAERYPVFLWSRTKLPPHTRIMPRLPNVTLPDNVTLFSDLSQIPQKSVAILLVVPTQSLREVSAQLKAYIPHHVPLITCCKGLEQTTEKLPLDILKETLPHHPHAVLSGPNFAIEVAKSLPTAATLAAKELHLAQNLAKNLSTNSFHLYANSDILGVQLAGAAKNVIAIGAGICTGASMGENARAALITRCLAELASLVEAMGGEASSLYSLAGIGDLILTATGAGSRNYSLGYALGQGETLENILKNRKAVSEGVFTAPALLKAAKEHHIEMPLIKMIAKILEGRLSINALQKNFFISK